MGGLRKFRPEPLNSRIGEEHPVGEIHPFKNGH